MKTGFPIAGISMLLAFGSAVMAAEQVEQTVLKRKGHEPELVDSATYRATRNEYMIKKGAAIVSLSATEVEYVKPPKPKGFDQCEDIGELEKIVQEHQRLWWDVEASKRLLPLYVKKGGHAKAIKLFRDLRSLIGHNVPVSLHREYWEALRMSDQKPKLEEELKRAVTEGSRELAAWAYIARGDLFLGQGSANQALVDGYLKTVILFDDIKSCRKEALEKTISVMDQIRDPRADNFRKALKEEFPKAE